MKLSTAIRIGSMTTRQIKGNFRDDGNGRCAIGAALDAVGFYSGAKAHYLDYRLASLFPLADIVVKHPIHRGMMDHVSGVVVTLNDHHDWSREAIADWVETIENMRLNAVEAPKQEAVI